jgi:hypothetical protein
VITKGRLSLEESGLAKNTKVAVVVRDRQSEALRMALGYTISVDKVSVYIMDDKLDTSDLMIEQALEGLNAMDALIYTNVPENPFEFLDTERIALDLLGFDAVVPY